MRILLSCCIGMSTSMLAEIMLQTCKKENKDYDISFIDVDHLELYINNCDVLLLGPQINHKYNKLNKIYGNKIPIAIIDSTDYGMLDGESVLHKAEKLYNDFKIKKDLG